MKTNQPERPNRAGFSGAEVVIVTAIVVIVGLLAWQFYERYTDNQIETNTSESSQAPEVIESSRDLQRTADHLQDINLNGELDTSEIDAALE